MQLAAKAALRARQHQICHRDRQGRFISEARSAQQMKLPCPGSGRSIHGSSRAGARSAVVYCRACNGIEVKPTFGADFQASNVVCTAPIRRSVRIEAINSTKPPLTFTPNYEFRGLGRCKELRMTSDLMRRFLLTLIAVLLSNPTPPISPQSDIHLADKRLLHRPRKYLPHPLQEWSYIPAFVESFQTCLHVAVFDLWPTPNNTVLSFRRI